MGETVKTITGHPNNPNEFENRVQVYPYNFNNPEQLVESLRGASILYNTYWIRFERGDLTFDKAVENSRILIKAAVDAGLKRIVHISIANPSESSSLPYYRGKALVEKAIIESGLTYAILRPTVLFGDQGILINNIAWFLRHLPVFAIPGSGEYKLQPISVSDLANLAVDWGHRDKNVVMDAVGPEQYTFNELMLLIREIIGSKSLILHVPSELALIGTDILGTILGDVILTRDGVKGLEENLLISSKPPTASTSLKNWLVNNAGWLGRRYFSEVKKHFA